MSASPIAIGCVGLALALPLACGGAQPEPSPLPKPTASAKTSDDRSGFADKSVTPYRSNRLGLVLPLPDRTAWIISDRDDTIGGWLQANHPATQSVVRIHRYEETGLVGRHECEMRAQLSGELPKEDELAKRHFESMHDDAVHRPKGWDARRWVAIEPRPQGKLAGHVYLIAGKARQCLVVHVLLEVKSDLEANDLADRLELFDARVVLGIAVDSAEAPGTLSPDFPKLPPTPGVP